MLLRANLLLLACKINALALQRAEQLTLSQQLALADTAQDRFNLLPDDESFVFQFNGKAGETIAANRKTFPALVGTHAGMAVGRIGPCGINTFHSHPRSAELQVVVQGRLITEMNPENGVLDKNGRRRIIRNEIGAFQMVPFYQGSIHTQYNPDCTEATFVSSFSTEDFGAEEIADGLFAFSDEALEAALGQTISAKDLDFLRNAIPDSVASGVAECRRVCAL